MKDISEVYLTSIKECRNYLRCYILLTMLFSSFFQFKHKFYKKIK